MTSNPVSAWPTDTQPDLRLAHAPRYEVQVSTMGTKAQITAVHGDAGLVEDAAARLQELHRMWTRFDADSDLSQINAYAGRPVSVTPETVLLVGLAVEAWKTTDGRYDPTVLPAVLAAGYDRDFAELSEATEAADDAGPSNGCTDVIVDTTHLTVTVPRGTSIDVSGIAKGLAADLLVADLLHAGAIGACVNIGGDLRVEGASPRPGGWLVGVEHPRDPLLLGCLRLRGGAVATSSRVKRSWGPADHRHHHIIDPTTGLTAYSGLQSVTAVASEGWRAEALATAAFLAGPDDGRVLLEAADASGLLVRDNDTVTVAGDWRALLV